MCGQGNCTRDVRPFFPEAGLFAHIDFIVPAGWPTASGKSRVSSLDIFGPPRFHTKRVSWVCVQGTVTPGEHTLTGMFVNNGPALAGTLMMDPDVDQEQCLAPMRSLPWCADFIPPPTTAH